MRIVRIPTITVWNLGLKRRGTAVTIVRVLTRATQHRTVRTLRTTARIHEVFSVSTLEFQVRSSRADAVGHATLTLMSSGSSAFVRSEHAVSARSVPVVVAAGCSATVAWSASGGRVEGEGLDAVYVMPATVGSFEAMATIMSVDAAP